MFHLLPDELNEKIIINLQTNPISLYNLQYVNQYSFFVLIK